MHPVLAFVFALAYAAALGALAAVVVARRRAARVVGHPLTEHLSGRRLRPLGAAGLVAAALVALRVGEPAPLVALPLLALALVVHVARPAARDRVCGQRGVRRGWYARSFAELEEWRLTGDHLRFRLFGEWTAVDLPAAEQADVRARLEELVPERQSRFSA